MEMPDIRRGIFNVNYVSIIIHVTSCQYVSFSKVIFLLPVTLKVEIGIIALVLFVMRRYLLKENDLTAGSVDEINNYNFGVNLNKLECCVQYVGQARCGRARCGCRLPSNIFTNESSRSSRKPSHHLFHQQVSQHFYLRIFRFDGEL